MEKRLYRFEHDKMLAGVCSGLADYFDVEVTWVRIAFIVATLAGFSGLLVYIILWIAIPRKPYAPGYPNYNTDYRVYNEQYTASSMPGAAQQTGEDSEPILPRKRKSGNGSVIAGLILIGFGGFFLLDEFDIIPYWFDFGRLWPLVIIIPGILMVARSGRKEKRWENRTDTDDTAKPADGTIAKDQPSI